MKNSPQKSLLAGYSTMAAGLILTGDLQAQIIYNDIDPDIELYAYYDDAFDLDLNGDLLPDFRFSAFYFIGCEYCDSGSVAQIIPLGSNRIGYVIDTSFSVCYTNTVSNYIAPVLDAGVAIDVAMNFTDDDVLLASKHFYDNEFCNTILVFGEWIGVTDRYVGLAVKEDLNTYYAWVRLSVDAWHDITIHEFAIQTIPDEPIIAGMIPDCFPPEPLGAAAITGTTAKLKWTAEAEVDHYELQYRPVGAAIWTTKNVPGIKTFRKVVGLLCDTEYEWQIKSICTDGEVSLYSAMQTFTTASCRMENENVIDEENIEIYTYANQLFVNIEEDIVEPGRIFVYDNLGRVISEMQIISQHLVFELDIPGGIYVIKINIQGNQYVQTVYLNQSYEK